MNADWLERFREQDVRFVVLSQDQDRQLIRSMLRHPGWSVDLEDDETVIFCRTDQGGQR